MLALVIAARRRNIAAGQFGGSEEPVGEGKKEVTKEEALSRIDTLLKTTYAGDNLSPDQLEEKHKLVEAKADLEHHWRLSDIRPWGKDPYTGDRWWSKEGFHDRTHRGEATREGLVEALGPLALLA